ncbi:MAG: hypothetical protein ACM3XN_03610 [Chloroflexota bacterium]
MEQLNDRVLVGVTSGLCGFLVKNAMSRILKATRVTKTDTLDKAATMFIRPRRRPEPKAVAVGTLADAVTSSLCGVGITYMLSVSGGDQATVKGALSGAALWLTMFGGLSSLGITPNHPVDPVSAIGSFVTNTAFGAVTAAAAVRIGSPELYNGKMPLHK